MKSFWRTFLKGFVTVIPLFITLYLFFWIVVTAESMVYGILKMVLTDKLYIPGMGIVLAFVLLYMLGLLMEKQKIARKLSDFSERQVARIPILKSFYSSLKNLMNFFLAAKKDEEDGLYKVVLVNLTDELHLIGFVTGDAQDQLGYTPDTNERIIAVYMPMSYQVGGYTLYLPQSRVTPLDIGFEEATQIVLTAGVGKKKAVI
jgi:uncharacterized membrane protein